MIYFHFYDVTWFCFVILQLGQTQCSISAMDYQIKIAGCIWISVRIVVNLLIAGISFNQSLNYELCCSGFGLESRQGKVLCRKYNSFKFSRYSFSLFNVTFQFKLWISFNPLYSHFRNFILSVHQIIDKCTKSACVVCRTSCSLVRSSRWRKLSSCGVFVTEQFSQIMRGKNRFETPSKTCHFGSATMGENSIS